VILPLAGLTAVVLEAIGWRRAAVAWCGVVLGTLGLMAVLKMALIACGHLLLDGALQSPSGHTASAALVYGGLLALGASVADGRRGFWPPACAVAAAAVIGATRLLLGVHTEIEVAVGAAIGVGAALLFVRLAGRPPDGWRVLPLAPAVLLVIAAFHGFHLPAEAAIRDGAARVWPLSECRP
jgi:membrane-associated phospholipid phosphatase